MNPLHQRPQRRAEQRRPAASCRLCWARIDAAGTATGWVKDVGPSSIAFVTPTRDRPAPGEAIDVAFGAATPSPRHQNVRVARIAPFDRFFSLVGCTINPNDKDAPFSELA